MDKHSAGKEFARYASLNMLGMLGISCYILADTFFISRATGAQGLAALNLALPAASVIPLAVDRETGKVATALLPRHCAWPFSWGCFFPSPASCLPCPWPRLWAPRGKCWK